MLSGLLKRTARLDFTLSVGSVNPEVTVTASAPLLESDTATLGQTIDNSTIVNLPLNGRNSYAFATLVPAVRTLLGLMVPGQIRTCSSPMEEQIKYSFQ
jgi:hypothetical protein